MKKIKVSDSVSTLPKHKMAVSMIFISMMLVAFVLMPPVAAEGQTQSTDITFHNVTVNLVDEEVLLQIEPLLLPEAGCVFCAENQTCPSGNKPTNITSTVLEQDECHTVILLTYEVNGATYEVNVARTLLWSYEELTEEFNSSASFIWTEITAENASTRFYSLSYTVEHEEYNLTVYTSLTPLNSETYNSSFTVMNYAPTGKSELTSLEFVKFNSSVTLSQQYRVLGKVAKEIGKIYEKSGDETLEELAQGYYSMEEEAKGLSKLVEKQLQEYDQLIMSPYGIIGDPLNLECLMQCLIKFCALNWWWCYWLCYSTCYPCISGLVAFCPLCAACIGFPAAYCLVWCTFS